MPKKIHRTSITNEIRKARSEVFRTPKDIYEPLLHEYKFLIEGDILDPSAGDGRFINSIMQIEKQKKANHAVYDIRKKELTAWKKNGLYKKINGNCFIENWLSAERTRKFDNFLTNPPFSLSIPFIKKGLKWVRPEGHVTILQRLNWLGTLKRSQWLMNMPLKNVIVIAKRPKWELDDRENNVTDTYEYCFLVFQKKYTGDPKVKWLLPL